MFKQEIQDALAALQAAGLKLCNKKLAILVDKPSETYRGTGIVKPDSWKALPLMGTIIAHGDDLSPEERDRFPLGDNVTFNRMGAMADQILIDGERLECYLISTLDANWRWPADSEVESCAE